MRRNASLLLGPETRQNAGVLEIREIGEEELGRLVAVRNAVWAHDPASPAEYVDWRRQAEDTIWLVCTVDGEDAGAGAGVHGWHSPPRTGRIELSVIPTRRRRGAGTALLGALGAWLADRGCDQAAANVYEPDGESLAWAARRGYLETGRSPGMELDLERADAPALDPPAGIEIVTWAERPELGPGLYEVYCEASPDVPGEHDVELPEYESWLDTDMRGAGDRDDAVFVALAGDHVVGYAKFAFSPGRDDVAWHDLTGVRRDWRGRGIAGALKRAQIAWAKRNGFQRLRTANEARNEPIRRLNRRHGYVTTPGTIEVVGPTS
jgi:GNAT superfamily N-acetyltransferase